jgi:hypothetical protein
VNQSSDQIARKVVSENTKCRPNKCALIFIAVVVAFKHTVYILYYEIHLKYFLGMSNLISTNLVLIAFEMFMSEQKF